MEAIKTYNRIYRSYFRPNCNHKQIDDYLKEYKDNKEE